LNDWNNSFFFLICQCTHSMKWNRLAMQNVDRNHQPLSMQDTEVYNLQRLCLKDGPYLGRQKHSQLRLGLKRKGDFTNPNHDVKYVRSSSQKPVYRGGLVVKTKSWHEVSN
jgi:hypothetical protein